MDQLLIINKALMKVGLPLAAALNDCDWNAQTVYESAVEEVLRTHNWGFAQEFVILDSTLPPAHGYDRGYALPMDCVRVIDVHCAHDLRSPRARYRVCGTRRLYSNARPANIRYVARKLDPAEWPCDFGDAVACKIALEISTLSAQTMSLAPRLFEMYQAALATAQASDARENRDRVPLDESIWFARAGSGGRP